MPNLGGRPTKLTPEVEQRIVDVLRGGGTRSMAYSSAGVSESTFLLWMSRARKEKRGKFLRFSERIRAAEQYSLLRNSTILNQLAVGGIVVESTRVTRPNGAVIVREKNAALLPGCKLYFRAPWWP